MHQLHQPQHQRNASLSSDVPVRRMRRGSRLRDAIEDDEEEEVDAFFLSAQVESPQFTSDTVSVYGYDMPMDIQLYSLF